MYEIMTKQGVKGKYERTLNEKYEIYLNSKRSIINTHILSSPQIITNLKKYIIIIWMWVGQLVYCNSLVTQTAWLQLSY